MSASLRVRLGLLRCLLAACAWAACGATNPIITIPLDKQYVPVNRNNKTVAYKTAYFGKVFLGLPSPQSFTVIFDTGSGHFFVPSGSCDTDTCRLHSRFDRQHSSTAVDLDHSGAAVPANATTRDQVAIAYGTGEVTGEFVREVVCMADHKGQSAGSQDCTTMRVILATEMTEEPFRTFKFDGVLGLGLDALAVDPEFSFFGQMEKLNNLTDASFGYYLSRTDDLPSEISFGGHDPRRLASELQWAPVHSPELGFWQVKIAGISIGGEALPFCQEGDCVAIADTGTSLIGAPRAIGQRLHWLLARKVPDNPSEIDCRTFAGPDLVFDLGDGVKVTVGPEDYSRPTAMKVMQSKTNTSQVVCRASLLPVDEDEVLGPKAFILGEPVLRKYYTAYDWREKRIGWALAKQPTAEEEVTETPRHTVFGAPPAAPPTPNIVHV